MSEVGIPVAGQITLRFMRGDEAVHVIPRRELRFARVDRPDDSYAVVLYRLVGDSERVIGAGGDISYTLARRIWRAITMGRDIADLTVTSDDLVHTVDHAGGSYLS